jgi:peptide subunit release factor 1 (eRF1)
MNVEANEKMPVGILPTGELNPEKILTREEKQTATLLCPHCFKTFEVGMTVKVVVDQTKKETQEVNVSVSLLQDVAPKGNWFTKLFRPKGLSNAGGQK